MKHQLKVVVLTMFFLALGGYEAAIAQDTAIVVATGYGQSVDLALKNASKNAMMQVVGTMIDASSTVESQLQIRGAVEEYAKTIESRTAEYSQGSIEQVELLSTDQDGPITIVTAKVTVRKEELQAYIARSTEAKASVAQGLFSKVQANKQQSENLNEIITRLLSDVWRVQVFDIKLGSLDTITNPKVAAAASRVLEPSADENIFILPANIALTDAFQANLHSTLERIAQIGERGNGVYRYNTGFENGEPKALFVIGDFTHRDDYQPQSREELPYQFKRMALYKFIRSPESLALYALPPEKAIGVCSELNRYFAGRNIFRLYAPLTLKVMDSSGAAIMQTSLTSEYGEDVRSSKALVVPKGFDDNTIRGGAASLTFLGYKPRDNSECVLKFDTQSEIQLIIKLTDEQLSRAHSIHLGLEQLQVKP